MKRINVGIFFGGVSTEHEVSRRSAIHILKSLDEERFSATLFEITGEGKLFACKAGADIQGCCADIIGDTLKLKSEAEPFSEELFSKYGIDVVFPIIHGTGGEDGTLQGFLEMCRIPYVGSGVLSSALGFDKVFTKKILDGCGIPQTPHIRLDIEHARDFREVADEAGDKLGYPVFVKPANGGSSVGIYKVKEPEDLEDAVEKAFRYDRKVLIEKGISGRELECAVIGGYDLVEALGVGEVVPCNEFYDYEAKYMDEGSETTVPADIDEETAGEIRENAIKAFKALDCHGLARVDFFVEDSGAVYLNEINTIPGFTSISMYPKLWKAKYGDDKSLVTKLLEIALERKRKYSFVHKYETEGKNE